jgi:CMP-N-acetylneuraminic acid synthetase
MSWRGPDGDLAVLAVVPARGGSKGLPDKNLRCVGGISLVGRAARLASSVDWIDRAILSTDDQRIATEGRLHGLDVPFMRPAELASDTASSVDTWRHALLAAEAHYAMRFEVSLLLEPTSPLRRPDDLTAAVATLVDGGHRSAATVSRSPAHFTPHKSLTVGENGRIVHFLADGARYVTRQRIPACYHRNGLCYAVTRHALLENGEIIGDDCVAVIVDRPVVNIDDAFELEMAEWLLTRDTAAESVPLRARGA